MNDKFYKKYMRIAKLIGEDQNPCYSRKIGVVIVDPNRNKVIGTGYNGPPKGVPHCDDRSYLEDIVWPQLTNAEKSTALGEHLTKDQPVCWLKEMFLNKYSGCKTCPRKVVGASSGQRLEICSCEHAEKNAIISCKGDTYGAWAFCWCGVPCYDCSKLIINADIKKVICFDWGADYSAGSRWLLSKAGVEVDIREPSFFLED